jgi:hypothetical protein
VNALNRIATSDKRCRGRVPLILLSAGDSGAPDFTNLLMRL